MTFTQTIIKYGEPEVVYIHVEPREGNQWYCTMSRLHPSNMRILGMTYDRDRFCYTDALRVVKMYAKFLENYYKV